MTVHENVFSNTKHVLLHIQYIVQNCNGHVKWHERERSMNMHSLFMLNVNCEEEEQNERKEKNGT